MRELSNRQAKAARAESGNFFDSTLASTGLYADLVSVDKRTSEYLRQIRKDNLMIDSRLASVTRLIDPKGLFEVMQKVRLGGNFN